MKPRDWDGVADEFDDMVLNPLGEDVSGFLRQTIAKNGGKHRTAIDLGCGVGRWLPLLSQHFHSVVAVDYSSKCLEVAAKKYAKLKNVSYRRADTCSAKYDPGQGRFDFAVMCNSLLDSNLKRRETMMRNLGRVLTGDGVAVVVVPSLESFLYTRRLECRHKIKSKRRGKRLETREGDVSDQSFLDFLATGVMKLDGVPTKYFLETEIRDLFRVAKLKPANSVRIEYPWSGVSYDALHRSSSSRPWDWGFLASR